MTEAGGERKTTANQPSYAQLAKRISSVTTKCLLTAMVLVAALGVGRQVLRWWADDVGQPVPAPQPQVADGLGDPWRLHVLQFGDLSWSMRRQSIVGDRRAAVAALRASCREVVRQDRLPSEGPGEAETEFLARMSATEPIDQEPGKWRLYALDEAFPAVVGTRDVSASDRASSKGLAGEGHRVTTWGLATPSESGAWTLHTFQPETSSTQCSAGILDIPIPPGCTRILSMRVVGGGSVTAFEGPQEARSWINFYDRWFRGHNWEMVGSWRQSGAAWHVRYSLSAKQCSGAVEVHFRANSRFGANSRNRFSGLLLITPPPCGNGAAEMD